jgi:YidC/Oxa1 family membrane protein insertase
MKSQLESTGKIQKIQPKLKKLQKKYKDNPQKLQQEQMKLYQQVGYNPLGCFLSVLIPYPFLVAIYQAIRAFSDDKVEGIYNFVSQLIGANGDLVINQRFLFWDLSKSYLPLGKEHGYMELWVLAYLLLAIIVGFSQYFSIKLSSARRESDDEDKKKDKNAKSKKKNGKKNGKENKKEDDKAQSKSQKAKEKAEKADEMDMEDMASDMGKSMMLTMPMMTTFIALSAPAAVSIYWIVQSWVLVGMRTFYYKFIKKE